MPPVTEAAQSGTAAARFQQHPQALVETSSVGDGTRISAFVHIHAGAQIGADCLILDHSLIEGDAVLGDRVKIGSGVRLWGADLADDVTIGANAAFAPAEGAGAGRTTVGRRVAIGDNATILAGTVIGDAAVISPGAVVTRNVPANAIVSGNPAQIVGYVGAAVAANAAPKVARTDEQCNVRGVELRPLPRFEDMRGALTVAEVQSHIPFPIQRFFLVYDVPSREVRGEHAHYTLHQFLICVRGSCVVLVDDGEHRHEFLLDDPSRGVYLPPMTWSVQYKHSPGAVLLVLASAPYDAADYIRDYGDFVKAVAAAKR